MKRWCLLAVGMLAVVGCHGHAQDSSHDESIGSSPIDQTNLTSGTVVTVPVAPPPPLEDRVPIREPATGGDVQSASAPEPLVTASWPPVSPVPAADPEAPVVPRARAAPPRAVPDTAPAFPETSFGSSRNTERAIGDSFPETTFGDYNTPEPANAWPDAGAVTPDMNIPR